MDDFGEDALWKTYIVQYCKVMDLNVREKRKIFNHLRNVRDPHTLLVRHGITIGDFCTFNVLLDTTKRT